jgi:CDP-glucose 4,6-dehydratase
MESLVKGARMKKGFWTDRTVFVTGCTGLLGSWLVRSLVDREADVVGLVRDSVPRSELNRRGLHEKIKMVRGSVEDYYLMERVLNEYEVDTVFHLAAQTIVTIANRPPSRRLRLTSRARGTLWKPVDGPRW